MRLFSNRSQITSKWGKNKKSGTRGDNWVSLMFLPHLTSSVIYYWTNAWQHGIYMFYIIKKTIKPQLKKFFYFIIFQHNSKARLWPLPTLVNTKKAIWRNLLSIQNEAVSLVAMSSKELWLAQLRYTRLWAVASYTCSLLYPETGWKIRVGMQFQMRTHTMRNMSFHLQRWEIVGTLAIY